MNIQDVYDASIVDYRTTGSEYPIWVVSDDSETPVIAISNNQTTYDLNADVFLISIEDQHIIGSCKIPTTQVSKIKSWVLRNKDVLLNHWFNEPYIFDTIQHLHI